MDGFNEYIHHELVSVHRKVVVMSAVEPLARRGCQRHRPLPNFSCHLPRLPVSLSGARFMGWSGMASSSTVSWMVHMVERPCSGDEGEGCGASRRRALEVFFWRRWYKLSGVRRMADVSDSSRVRLQGDAGVSREEDAAMRASRMDRHWRRVRLEHGLHLHGQLDEPVARVVGLVVERDAPGLTRHVA